MLSLYLLQLVSFYLTALIPLSLAAALSNNETTTLVKRDDYPPGTLLTLWNSIPGEQKSGGDSALPFYIEPGKADKWGITYLYGCTAVIVTDVGPLRAEGGRGHIIVSHFQQDGRTEREQLKDPRAVQSYFDDTFGYSTLNFNELSNEATIDLIYDCKLRLTPGAKKFKELLAQELGLESEDDKKRIREWDAPAVPGTGEPSDGGRQGMAAITWTPGPEPNIGTLKVFNGNEAEQPIHDITVAPQQNQQPAQQPPQPENP